VPGIFSRLSVFVVLLLTSQAWADDLPDNFGPNRFNGSGNPHTEGGVTLFNILNEECSSVDYGDGRGENDCLNGNVRSNIGYERETHVGDALEYRFDIRVPTNLNYAGYHSEMAAGFLPDAWDTYLSVASWEGNLLHNFIYQLKLDTTKGLAFLGRTCQPADRFGEWVKFSMKVRWANDEKGWIKVACDDMVIYAAEGTATTENPHCYIRNQCEPGLEKEPNRIVYLLGPQMRGHGHDWKQIGEASPFVKFQSDGIAIEMRNIAVKADPDLYSPDEVAVVRQLQTRLNELGCDVGTADGVAGKRTREAALSCRAFPAGKLPDAFNVATAPAFLALYQDGNAADLPRGQLPGTMATVTPKFTVKVGEHYSNNSGKNPEIYAEYIATVSKPTKREVRFGLVGTYNFRTDSFLSAKLLVLDDLGTDAPDLSSCGSGAAIRVDSGRRQLAFKLTRIGADYVVSGSSCVLQLLPKQVASTTKFLLDNFSDVAVGFVFSGKLKTIRNDGLRSFFTNVASGEVRVLVE
jgi:hypothetical protein